MAVQHGYGKIAGTDALVFAYDTGDTRNSYKGEPTTNLTTDTPSQNGWGGSYSILESSSKTFQMQLDQAGADTAWRTWYWSVSSYESSYVTISFDFELIETSGADVLYFSMGQGNTGTYPTFIPSSTAADRVTDSSGASRHFTWSGIINAAGLVGCTMRMQNGISGGYIRFKISNVQIEAKSHETPFVNGTRSATQGLLDLTGNTSVNISTVSFDSNAQMTFDGTDDIITIPMDNVRPTAGITQEVVVYIDNNTTQVFIGSQYGTSSNNSYAIWLSAADSLSGGVNIGGSFNYQTQSYTITVGRYYHFVHTYDGTTQRIYANGIEIRQWATTGNIEYNTNNTLLAIGNDWNGSGYNVGASLATHGKQDITKIYNRALTAAEVANNYNHYKGRFNI